MPAILDKIKNSSRKTTTWRGKFSPVGLDLGSAMIKMVQLKKQRGIISVSNGFISRTPEGAFNNGELINPDLLARKIKAVFDQDSWQGSSINISLNPQAFYYRTVRMPRLEKEALRKAMYWEALQNFPLNEGEVVFDYCLLDTSTGNDNKPMEYILAAAMSKTANLYTRLSDQAGLNCCALEIEPLSLFRSFKSAQAGSVCCGTNNSLDKMQRNKPNILIHIGFHNTTLLITGTNKLFFYRNIKIGTNKFIRAVQENQDCSARNAEKYIFNHQASAGKDLEKALLDPGKQLTLKIEQGINLWLDQFGQADPGLHNLQFCGGGAFIPGLATAIARHLQLRHALYNPLIKIGDDSTNSENKAYRNREKLFFPVAHGLALRGWEI